MRDTKPNAFIVAATLPPELAYWVGHWARNCEGDTETRPLIYRDSLRQGEPNRCDTLTVVILSFITYTWERGGREHT